MKERAIDILGEDDFIELQSEINTIMKDPERTTIDKYLDVEKLMNEWGIEVDYLQEFLD